MGMGKCKCMYKSTVVVSWVGIGKGSGDRGVPDWDWIGLDWIGLDWVWFT